MGSDRRRRGKERSTASSTASSKSTDTQQCYILGAGAPSSTVYASEWWSAVADVTEMRLVAEKDVVAEKSITLTKASVLA